MWHQHDNRQTEINKAVDPSQATRRGWHCRGFMRNFSKNPLKLILKHTHIIEYIKYLKNKLDLYLNHMQKDGL
jgi:hypothetical protein